MNTNRRLNKDERGKGERRREGGQPRDKQTMKVNNYEKIYK